MLSISLTAAPTAQILPTPQKLLLRISVTLGNTGGVCNVGRSSEIVHDIVCRYGKTARSPLS
jgi:hypothetical protein